MDDSNKGCIKMCYSENDANCDGKWKIEDCSTSLNYVCEIPCKKKNL